MKKTVLKIVKITAENNIELYKKMEMINKKITRIIPTEDKKIYEVYYETKE